MTNDELLAKMLDGTITPAENKQLTSEALKNSTLAEAITQLRHVEALLALSPNNYSAATEEYLKSIEDEIAEKVRDNRRKPVPILPPYIDTKWNWNILLYTVSAILTVGAAGYFGYTALTTPSKNPATNPTETVDKQLTDQTLKADPAQGSSNANPSAQSTTRNNIGSNSNQNNINSSPSDQVSYFKSHQNQSNSNDLGQSIHQPVAEQPSQPQQIATRTEVPSDANLNEIDGAASSSADKKMEQITLLTNQLVEKHAIGDKVGEMALNKQIGMLYSKSGKHDIALRYLDLALTHSRSVNAKSEEGLILGEIGLLELKSGNKDSAMSKLQQAIDLLSKSGLNHDKLSRELAKITK